MVNPYRPQEVISATAKAFQLTADALYKGRRTPHRTRARWAATYLLRQTGTLSWGDIARALGYGDHTSALHGAAAARRLAAADRYYRDLLRGLQVSLGLPLFGQEHLEAKPEDVPTGGS